MATWNAADKTWALINPMLAAANASTQATNSYPTWAIVITNGDGYPPQQPQGA